MQKLGFAEDIRNMKKAVATLAILLTVIMMFCACSNNDKVKSGTYISTEAIAYGYAGVVLSDDDEFLLYFDALSHCPTGKYAVEGDTLTFVVSDEEVYVFTIKDDKLIFESGEWAEKMLDKGAVFKLSDE